MATNMKIAALAVSSVIVAIAALLLFQGGAKTGANHDAYSCARDSDCVKAKGDCCGCNYGGTATAISRGFENEWNGNLTQKCRNIFCPAVISNDPSCFREPKCVNDRCALE